MSDKSNDTVPYWNLGPCAGIYTNTMNFKVGYKTYKVVHGRARQSSYHITNCFDLRCARRPISRHTLAEVPVPCLVILNAPASTEFYQEGIDSLLSLWPGMTDSKEYQAGPTTLMTYCIWLKKGCFEAYPMVCGATGAFKTWPTVGILHKIVYPTMYTSSPKDELSNRTHLGMYEEEYRCVFRLCAIRPGKYCTQPSRLTVGIGSMARDSFLVLSTNVLILPLGVSILDFAYMAAFDLSSRHTFAEPIDETTGSGRNF
ncbi:hypothetical protein ARMGADRAFT_1093355 [Armillaria gallica]|uniref:Uncharacterized protein n=1 Tax=Armillaria gallica TaxID=47427 RepID=A0A2H3CD22_ARMGA|nr:hypothetical protein ARMGADRAFT_1093355 [Armillaria gallica]